MSSKPLLALCAAAGLLSACEKYTEKTSPCFGKNGAPQVSRAALSFVAGETPEEKNTKPDCTFESLPRPE